MNSFFLNIIVVASFSGLFHSCLNDETDTESPNIILHTPIEEQMFKTGESIPIHILFSDNVGVASYKIEIHIEDDGHTHKSAELEEWFYSVSHEILNSPKSYELTDEIYIPIEINGKLIEKGHYHFGVYVLDSSGNEQQTSIEIEIE